MSDLEQRIERLEAIEAIKCLKAKYLHACDRKDIEGIRNCFAEGEVVIDYGAVGTFNNREQLIAVFQEMAASTGVIDAHHGQNPQISVNSSDSANAVWDLYFYQINPETKGITQLAGYYQDKYVKIAGEWKISETVFRVASSFMANYESDALKVLFAGAAPSF